MTKKDYVLIAQAIEAAVCDHACDMRTLVKTASLLADQLAFDNLRFDRARFLQACGVTNK